MTDDDMKLSRTSLIIGAIVLVATLAAVVVLDLAGLPSSDVIGIAGPVVVALLVTGRVDQRADQQDTVIHTIQQQTNGVLDQRIRDGARAALRDAGITPATSGPPAAHNEPTSGPQTATAAASGHDEPTSGPPAAHG